jgi:hypothetical protein
VLEYHLSVAGPGAIDQRLNAAGMPPRRIETARLRAAGLSAVRERGVFGQGGRMIDYKDYRDPHATVRIAVRLLLGALVVMAVIIGWIAMQPMWHRAWL